MIARKKSLRDYCNAKRAREGSKTPVVPRNGALATKPRSPLKKVSSARQREMARYYRERAEFLGQPKNAACAICLCLGQGAAPATEVHHSRGRIGRLLLDQRFWVPSCRACREIPHNRPNWARDMGLLATATDWNTVPFEA